MILDFPIHHAKRKSIICKRRAIIQRDLEYIKTLPLISGIAQTLYARYQDELAEVEQALHGSMRGK